VEEKIRDIIKNELEDDIESLKEIIGLGQVNRVYEISGVQKEYIIRAIKSPEVLKVGKELDINYMIQEKIKGLNGKLCNVEEKLEIWYKLGSYAKKYHQLKRIKIDEFEQNEFHDSWKSRLYYNIKELNEEDSLLKNKIFTEEEHQKAKSKLKELKAKELKEGLVHGDLCYVREM